MKRTVSSMMSRDVCVVDMDDTIASVEKRLADRHLSWAPVLEGRRAILGVIGAADLLRFHAAAGDPENVRAWQMCTYKPIAVAADADLVDVARSMVERGIHHVVVTAGDEVVGVLSSLDFVREFAAGAGRVSAAT
jgi:signal-transduction protein with cAMP-binding, CBS, and nucleotidyltransferase domain